MARERKFTEIELFQITYELLMKLGYEGFTFSALADELDVSRGALYKYFNNKDELITKFMLFEMEKFLIDLKEIHTYTDFEDQFEFLITLIFNNPNLPHLILIGQQIPSKKYVKENLSKLKTLHLRMYEELQAFIDLGKQTGFLKQHIPHTILLGVIFQTIAIPNHFGIPHAEWVNSIKEILISGMFVRA